MLEGLLGKKLGMTQIFDKGGSVVPVTIVEAGPCYVTSKNDDKNVVQVGFGRSKKLSKPKTGHLKKASIELPLSRLKEFKTADASKLTLGQEIKADIFKEGDLVNVSGLSIGKGFAGTVKRHHFRRSPMSHGSKSHRIPGSIGAGTTPGRVYKGKKLGGRMGGENVTVKNLKIVSVDAANNLVFLRGAVPGVEGSALIIRKGK